MDNAEKIKNFWNWFETNNHKYLFLDDISEEEKENLMNELLAHLHEYCDELYFEIGGDPDKRNLELIITAEGIRENFPKVEELINAAPRLKDWVFIKFKPALGPGFITDYEGTKFDPAKIIYIPLDNRNDQSLIGLNVCYPELNEDNREKYLFATYIMVDTLIGEKSAVEDIDYLNVINTPADIAEYNFMHLCDIGDYIKQKKHGGGHQ